MDVLIRAPEMRPEQKTGTSLRNRKVPNPLYLLKKMEHTGFEPVTSTLPVWRAPSCANAPCVKYIILRRKIKKKLLSRNFYL